MIKLHKIKYIGIVIISLFASFDVTSSYGENAPIILPGAPGEPSKKIDAETATKIANSSYIKADIDFLKGMIIHHKQAMLMSQMAGDRTNNKTIVDLANRIDVSQEDEISFMESWLKERDEFKSDAYVNSNMDHMDHMDHMDQGYLLHMDPDNHHRLGIILTLLV